MNLQDLAFPVYKLRDTKPLIEEGVTFYVTPSGEAKIVDDIAIEGNSLARRRLSLHMAGIKLLELKVAIFFPADLIKVAKPSTYFIDSNGKVFQYKKTKMVPLIFREISSVQRMAAFSLVTVKGINGRHKILYPPTREQKYAGLLRINAHAYILYGFFTELHKDTVRKI